MPMSGCSGMSCVQPQVAFYALWTALVVSCKWLPVTPCPVPYHSGTPLCFLSCAPRYRNQVAEVLREKTVASDATALEVVAAAAGLQQFKQVSRNEDVSAPIRARLHGSLHGSLLWYVSMWLWQEGSAAIAAFLNRSLQRPGPKPVETVCTTVCDVCSMPCVLQTSLAYLHALYHRPDGGAPTPQPSHNGSPAPEPGVSVDQLAQAVESLLKEQCGLQVRGNQEPLSVASGPSNQPSVCSVVQHLKLSVIASLRCQRAARHDLPITHVHGVCCLGDCVGIQVQYAAEEALSELFRLGLAEPCHGSPAGTAVAATPSRDSPRHSARSVTTASPSPAPGTPGSAGSRHHAPQPMGANSQGRTAPMSPQVRGQLQGVAGDLCTDEVQYQVVGLQKAMQLMQQHWDGLLWQRVDTILCDFE